MSALILKILFFLVLAVPAVAQETLTASDGAVYQVREVQPMVPIQLAPGESLVVGRQCETVRVSFWKQVDTCTWTGVVVVDNHGNISEVEGGSTIVNKVVPEKVIASLAILLMITAGVLILSGVVDGVAFVAAGIAFTATIIPFVTIVATLVTLILICATIVSFVATVAIAPGNLSGKVTAYEKTIFMRSLPVYVMLMGAFILFV